MYLNFIRLPLGAGGGWAATISFNQILSGDVATLLFQILWAFIISLFNRSNPRPFFAETVTMAHLVIQVIVDEKPRAYYAVFLAYFFQCPICLLPQPQNDLLSRRGQQF